MPRKSTRPRLYLDPKRKQWVVRDGDTFVRTGCDAANKVGALIHPGSERVNDFETPFVMRLATGFD